MLDARYWANYLFVSFLASAIVNGWENKEKFHWIIDCQNKYLEKLNILKLLCLNCNFFPIETKEVAQSLYKSYPLRVLLIFCLAFE